MHNSGSNAHRCLFLCPFSARDKNHSKQTLPWCPSINKNNDSPVQKHTTGRASTAGIRICQSSYRFVLGPRLGTGATWVWGLGSATAQAGRVASAWTRQVAGVPKQESVLCRRSRGCTLPTSTPSGTPHKTFGYAPLKKGVRSQSRVEDESGHRPPMHMQPRNPCKSHTPLVARIRTCPARYLRALAQAALSHPAPGRH